MKSLILKPAAGLKVRDPLTGAHLAAEGETKPASQYWLRRRNAGDVIEVKPNPKGGK